MSPGGCSSPLGSSSRKTQKIGCRLASPGGQGPGHQAIPLQEPRISLAGVHHPPGGVWNNSRNPNFNMNSKVIMHKQLIHHAINLSTQINE